MANWLSMIPAAVSLASTAYSNISQKKRAKEQVQAQKELNTHAMGLQHGMWKDTNFSAQIEEMKKANLSPGLVYGMNGAGGATTGSVGGSASKADTQAIDLQSIASLGLMKAQKELIEAQTEKTEAEATKTLGVDTTEKEIANRRNQINLEIAEELGVQAYARRARIEMQALNAEDAQKIREFEAWMAEAFDPNSNEINVDAYGSYATGKNDLIRKVKQAGLKQTIQELNNLAQNYQESKSREDLNKIEAEIREFKADLTELGLNETTSNIINSLLKLLFSRK